MEALLSPDALDALWLLSTIWPPPLLTSDFAFGGGKERTKRLRLALAESDRCAAELQELFEGAHPETIRGMGDWLEESK